MRILKERTGRQKLAEILPVLLLLCFGLQAAPVLAAGQDQQQLRPVPPSATTLEVQPITAKQLLKRVRQPGAKAVLVNVWATWCRPCVEEFPDLVRLGEDFKGRGLKIIFISADFESNLTAVQSFLHRQGVSEVSYLKVEPDEVFIGTLSEEWSGSIPATFVYDGSGRQRYFHEGKGNYALFSQMVEEVLNNR